MVRFYASQFLWCLAQGLTFGRKQFTLLGVCLYVCVCVKYVCLCVCTYMGVCMHAHPPPIICPANRVIFKQGERKCFCFLFFFPADICKLSFPDQLSFTIYFVLLNGFPRRKVRDSKRLPHNTDKIFCLIRH